MNVGDNPAENFNDELVNLGALREVKTTEVLKEVATTTDESQDLKYMYNNMVKMRGTYCVYYNVEDSIPQSNFESAINTLKEHLQDWRDIAQSEGYCVVFVPVKNSQTRIELLRH